MNRSAKCKLCDYKVTKNGYIALRSTMITHAIINHPTEYNEKKLKDYEISLAIRELKKSKILLWSSLEKCAKCGNLFSPPDEGYTNYCSQCLNEE